jgi:TonB-linked SusC/RagA family outer membrane protein
MKRKIVLSLWTCLIVQCLAIVAYAQNVQVNGKVTSKATGAGLGGASVAIKGSTNGTATDEQGNYTIAAPSGATLVVSFAGMTTLERVIKSGGVQNFVLEEGDSKLEEVVVVGYGTQKKTSLTASVSTVSGADVQRQPVGDLTNALGGRASGILFTQASGQAGNDASRIMIRGIGTNGNSSPLLIVDGVPRNFSQLNPADIETITVLKDAAAVAPYGLGGANGVILVTTKKGKSGKPVLTYDGYVGFQNPTITTRFVNSYQFATMKNEGARNAGSTDMPFSAEVMEKYRNGSDPDKYPDIDPLNDMIQKNTMITNHSLSLSGGTDAIKYAMGFGFLNQEGMFPGIEFQRYNLSANVQAQATKSTTIGLSINGRVEKRTLSGAGYNEQSIFENLINTVSNTTPLTYSNGLHPYIYAYFYDNPSYQHVRGNTLLNQLSIEQKLPLKGLSMKFVGSYDLNPYDPFSSNFGINSVTRRWSEPFTYHTVDTTTNPYTYPQIPITTLPSFGQEFHETQAFTYQGYLNYTGNFGNHNVTGLVVLESRNTKSQRFSAGRNNYNLPIPELFAGGGGETDISNDGNSMGTKQRSIVYRATYSYANKYMLEAAGRYDGHYYFAPGKRFGFFPAFSAGWRISQENFMKDVRWVNELKLKGSWGQSGNLAGSAYQYQTGFELYGRSAILNGVQTQGLYERAEPNPNITWEKANKTDIGLEARLFNNAISIEADYFFEKRANMLLAPNVTVPSEYGVGLAQVNAGLMENRGFEFTISGNYNINKDFRVGLSGNFTYAKNKMIEIFEDPATFDNPNLRRTGRPLGVAFGYQALGYFTDADFASPGVLKDGIAKQTWNDKLYPGDIRYADISGPGGKPDGVIDYNDQIELGHPSYPAIVYGFTPSVHYKGFELSILFQGVGQRQIQIGNSAAWAFDNNKNAPITTLDYWTPQNPNASYPRMTTTPTPNNTQTSTFWHRSVSYLRLRTGMLSYTLPSNFTRKASMSMVQIYVSGQNIFTWTPIENFDPEISNGRGWYFPTQKAITAGLRVQF